MAKQIRNHAKIKIDEKEFEKLCAIHCTQQEIAEWFTVSPDTIDRWCKLHFKEKFAEVHKRLSAKGKASLRRTMFQTALNGNVTMMIWLSKQYLGMSEKQEFQMNTKNANVDLNNFQFVEPKEQ